MHSWRFWVPFALYVGIVFLVAYAYAHSGGGCVCTNCPPEVVNCPPCPCFDFNAKLFGVPFGLGGLLAVAASTVVYQLSLAKPRIALLVGVTPVVVALLFFLG